MIVLEKFEEISPGMGYDRLRDHLEDAPYEGKEKILDYLKNGDVHMVTAGRVMDEFTGDRTDIEKVFMDDGTYSWSSSLIYYVENYNLRLPEAFECYVLNKK